MKKTLLFTTLLFSLYLNAQTSISGVIVDENQENIPFANLLVINKKDSSLIQGQFVTDGKFKVVTKAENYLIKITSFSYEDKYIPITKNKDLGVIKLTKLTLEEVTINGRKQAFELKDGVTKINVENSIFQSSSSVNEILSKSPGVIVSGTDISVIGKGNALVYIDSKLSSAEALSAIPVSQIEAIEIIKNPDASYEAEGKSVVLVHLKELGLDGFQGKFLSHYTKAFYQLGYLDLNLNWHQDKLSISASGNTNFGSTGSIRTDELKAPNLETPYNANSKLNEKVKLDVVSNYLLGIKYQLKPKHNLSLEYNGNYSFYELDVTTKINQFLENDSITINALNKGTSIWQTDVISGNYQWKTDTLGSNLFIGATYSAVSKDYSDKITETATKANNSSISNSLSESNNLNQLNIVQVDYSKQYPNASTLKMGLKYSNTKSSTSVRLNTINNDSTINNINNSYIYSEQINAGYINWKSQWKKGYYEIGTRIEHTIANAKKEMETTNYIDTNYFGFFPNINFTTKFKKWTMSDKLNFKISRPNFNEITPYIYYLNAFTSVKGNPNIKPSYVYNFEHLFSNEKWGSSISLGLNHERQPKIFVVFQTDSGETSNTIQVINLKRYDQLYVELSQSVELKGVTGYNLINISLNKLEDDNLDFGDMAITPKTYFYSYTKFPIKKWFNFELLGSYTSKYSDGRRTIFAKGELGFGLSKSFGNNKWFAQLFCNDILQTSKNTFKILLNGNTINGVSTQDNRYLRLTVSYKFGKLKNSQYNHNNINNTELNRAK